jgi:hypothetical protein
MSRHKQFRPHSLDDYPLSSRPSKVNVSTFSRPLTSDSFSAFVNSLPDQLAAQDLRRLARSIRQARTQGKPVIWAFGGHVVKVGLAPVLIDLMERGFVGGLATNGAGMIHDFEIALCGHTSEDVDQQVKTGSFGMARETGELLNHAIREGASARKGAGESVGAFLAGCESLACPQCSVLLQAYRRNIPVTIHVAIGTDIIHNHPAASGSALGETSLIDFRILTQLVSELSGGGVFLNLGSAVLIPEVFLKAVSVVRNSGLVLRDFTTANLDFIQHYRPTHNIVRRPVAGCGTGIALTGHHEVMVPLLAAMLVFPGEASGQDDQDEKDDKR